MEYKTASPDLYPLLRTFARENRKNMTLAEKILWDGIRKNFVGHKFLRQHIIGDYIVDFLCRDDGLVIEVDGAYHSERDQQEYDEERTEWLTEKGYQVLRFTNEEVYNEYEQVIETIEQTLSKQTLSK